MRFAGLLRSGFLSTPCVLVPEYDNLRLSTSPNLSNTVLHRSSSHSAAGTHTDENAAMGLGDKTLNEMLASVVCVV